MMVGEEGAGVEIREVTTKKRMPKWTLSFEQNIFS